MIPTDDLIVRLAAEPMQPPLRPARLAWLIGVAIVLPVALFLAVAGPRPDLMPAWRNPVVPFKTLLPLLTSGLSLTLLLRLTRPQARAGFTTFGYAVPVLAALALWVGAFVLRAPPDRFAEIGVKSLAECLGIIPALAVVPTLVALRLIRAGASVAPGLSAALAGLTAGTGAAAGYSLFCTRDNPLFFVTWYGTAILTVTLVAFLFGRRQLVW